MLKNIIFVAIFLVAISFKVATANNESKLKSHEFYMEKLYKVGLNYPDAPFISSIVDKKTGEVLCVGINHSAENPLKHGEMDALDKCIKKYSNKKDWANTILYTTAEPCSMCQGAIVWTGIGQIVYGSSIPYLTAQGWDQIGVRATTINKESPFYKGNIIGGILSKQTDLLFKRK